MVIEAHAKINWTLNTVGKRDDGYHLLDMILQEISLCDKLTLEEADEITFRLDGRARVPETEDNLALKAARRLAESTGMFKGAAITLKKAIPVCAGMGGGSADAAAVLRGLNILWGLHLPMDELCRIGLTLGADVPYCLRGGLMRAQGIGEALTPLACARNYPLVAIQPCRGLSTRHVFTAYKEEEVPASGIPDNDGAAEALSAGDLARLSDTMGNALEHTACALRPAISDALRSLKDHGARAAQMTGSGSAVFGVFTDIRHARDAYARLAVKWPTTYLTHTIGLTAQTPVPK
jgi:4-diphosphocytidyl-2-C-methyl-D-erythritol kinase